MTYSYSFSGTDVKAFAERDSDVFSLNSLATISFQVNEQKSPVRRLGRQGVVGFTRSIKTIAGTMVFVILKDHPLRELMPNNNLTLRHKEVSLNMPHQATNILPFNLRLKYKAEHSGFNFSELFIEGIEIISQSIVTSVNDMVTELIVQFMGRDYKEFYNSFDKENYLASLITENDLNNDLQLQEQYNNEQLLNREDVALAENETNNYYIKNINDYFTKLSETERTNSNFDPWGDQIIDEINTKSKLNIGDLNPEALDSNYVRDERDPYGFDYLRNITNNYKSSPSRLELLSSLELKLKSIQKEITSDTILLQKYIEQNKTLNEWYPPWEIESKLTLNNRGVTNNLRLWYNKEIDYLARKIRNNKNEEIAIKEYLNNLQKNLQFVKTQDEQFLKNLERRR